MMILLGVRLQSGANELGQDQEPEVAGHEPGEGWWVVTVRIIKHEAVPQTGSFEVRFASVAFT